MNRQDLAAAMAAFEKQGGQVKKVKEGERAIAPGIRHCRCGCRGNWTDHTMHLGEMGIR